ncbi:MAG: hypothetical protein RsTaC01_0262 [Candidatus Paraimprobicoccus trichonymphae]|uniref:YbbR-like protein n=1 Tax=Candidatus Paraimprobicoccus trichonymphae TaxID=3033793 RepID=A0AA48IHA8_9FIRM|nr:MAG: hypothetical protein RsTaC01_0262 [Candidatus Paraimprobicoccus trichonymphae]
MIGIRKIFNLDFRKLFYNKKFIVVFSVILSFIIWIVVSINDTESHPITIYDIPVNISLSNFAVENGLRIFSGQDVKTQVDVTGNRLIVGKITKNDILVAASQIINDIIKPGSYTLELTAKKSSLLTDYKFASEVKPNFIIIMVDRYIEAEFEIEKEINFKTNSEYFTGNQILSQEKVILSGPETEMSRVKKVLIKENINKELKNYYKFKTPILLLDSYNEVISTKNINCSVSEIEVTIPVFVKKTVKINPNFENVPENLNIKNITKINPEHVEIIGPEEIVKDLNQINLDYIDLEKVNLNKTNFELRMNLPENCKVLNNNYTVKLSFLLNNFKEKTLWITDFEFLNVPENKSVKLYNEGLFVKFIGPESKITQLKSQDVYGEADLEENSDLSQLEIPISVKFRSLSDIWIYGNYFVNISVK